MKISKTDNYKCPCFDNANFFSKVQFWFTLPFFLKFYGKPIETTDCYQCSKTDKSDVLGNRLLKFWEMELKKRELGHKPSLLKAYIRAYGLDFGLFTLCNIFVDCVLRILPLVAMSFLIKYLDKWQKSKEMDSNDEEFGWHSNRAYIYYSAVSICIVQAIACVTSHPYFFLKTRLGMQIRLATNYLIYNKALRVSNSALRTTTIGTIVNLLSTDCYKFDTMILYIHFAITGPVLMVCIFGFLWYELQMSCLAGLAFMAVYTPFQTMMGPLFSRLRTKIMVLTDNRLKLMNEIIPAMRVIKMYVWEKPFGKLIELSRVREIQAIHKVMNIRAFNLSLFYVSGKVMTFLCLLIFILTNNQLNAENVFVTIGLVNLLRRIMTQYFPYSISLGAETLVSVHRIEKFLLLNEFQSTHHLLLTNSEVPDPYKKSFNELKKMVITDESENHISVENICANHSENEGKIISILDDISFDVKPGELTVIIGSVGSGKTAVLMALLKELNLSSGTVSVRGRLGYASQESWIFGGTVKDNILFGQTFDERKYRQIVHVCALDDDLKQLPFGDQTFVGERGVSLSGGQRARVSLARTLYSGADCFLLDDPLSAVDSSVAKHIFEKCIKGYLKSHCVVLVTHQLQFIKAADQIVVLNDGKCIASGSYTQLLNKGLDLIKYAGNSDLQRDDKSKHISDMITSRTSSLSQLSHISLLSHDSSHHSFPDEEVYDERGIQKYGDKSEDIISDPNNPEVVSTKVYWTYMRAGAGIILIPAFFLSNIITQSLFTGSDYWLSQWTGYLERKHIVDGPVERSWMVSEDMNTNIIIYSLFVALIFIFSISKTVIFFVICMRSSVNLHNKLLESVLRAPVAFFDKYPIGMIINRVSRDLGIIDDILPTSAFDALEILLDCMAVFILCAIVNPWVVIPTGFLFISNFLVIKFALNTIRKTRTVEAKARSPVFSHLTSTINGLTTIRAFGREMDFSKKFNSVQDTHTNTYFMSMVCTRWFGIILDELSIVYIIALTILMVANLGTFDSSVIGLTLSQAFSLTTYFSWGIRLGAEVETYMTSVERVNEMKKIDRELDSGVQPPEGWPQKGEIIMRDVSLQYEGNDNPVLHNLNLVIKSGETVGIVGRTGAGKSSIITTLFRMTPPTGLIQIDGIDTSAISLSALRRIVSIIPQEPIVFTETIRKNLDPFGECSDALIWEALAKVELKSTVTAFPQKLDQLMSESAGTFSVGQKQLICMARAILRNNKILVLDEATANCDPRTDALIQETIRKSFTDCTVLTIAHRLNTIMDYDKCLVLDAGVIAQFDSPYILSKDRDGIFAQMLESTGKDMEQHLKDIAYKAYVKKRNVFH